MKRNIVLVCALLLLISGCTASPEEKKIRKNYSDALLPGYTNLQTHYEDLDIHAIVFGYTYTPSTYPTLEDTFAVFESAIPNYTLYSKDANTVVLRQKINPDEGGTNSGFNEYRFMVNPGESNITVLYANLDSDAERAEHDRLVGCALSVHEGKGSSTCF